METKNGKVSTVIVPKNKDYQPRKVHGYLGFSSPEYLCNQGTNFLVSQGVLRIRSKGPCWPTLSKIKDRPDGQIEPHGGHALGQDVAGGIGDSLALICCPISSIKQGPICLRPGRAVDMLKVLLMQEILWLKLPVCLSNKKEQPIC